ncbi:hypothetical protein LLG90_03420 [Aromatoleum toluclasticum]|uniref:hypothetical protein n=1 Tax=Aromatoleum toluclasticum TaxID=92003 RepID=UPI001D189B3C|nr:hypothetical protein [Aromatoleum toluclasticum]MCC4114397.1 hypothetical protein [Aromatoleum toluclasticum]
MNSPASPDRNAVSTAFERSLLVRLPFVLAGGTLIAGLAPALARVMAWAGIGPDPAASITTADIIGLSILGLTFSTVAVLAIGAVIVLIMKGPAYFADSYPLQDADRPDPPSQARASTRGR